MDSPRRENNSGGLSRERDSYYQGHGHPDRRGKTLYVGNLDNRVSETLLKSIFSQAGRVVYVKVFRHRDGDATYAFVEFPSEDNARHARSMLDGSQCLGRNMKIRWSSGRSGSANNSYRNYNKNSENDFLEVPTPAPKSTTHYQVFVGNLDSRTTADTLRAEFSAHGKVSNAWVTCSGSSSNQRPGSSYGFVSFTCKADAEKVVNDVGELWIDNRFVKAAWANYPEVIDNGNGQLQRPRLEHWDVPQNNSTSTSVYVGNLIHETGCSEETAKQLKSMFEPLGVILGVKTFPDKSFGFLEFESRDAAANAIATMNGAEFQKQKIKCGWGKEWRWQNSRDREEGDRVTSSSDSVYGSSNKENSRRSSYPSSYDSSDSSSQKSPQPPPPSYSECVPTPPIMVPAYPPQTQAQPFPFMQGGFPIAPPFYQAMPPPPAFMGCNPMWPVPVPLLSMPMPPPDYIRKEYVFVEPHPHCEEYHYQHQQQLQQQFWRPTQFTDPMTGAEITMYEGNYSEPVSDFREMRITTDAYSSDSSDTHDPETPDTVINVNGHGGSGDAGHFKLQMNKNHNYLETNNCSSDPEQ